MPRDKLQVNSVDEVVTFGKFKGQTWLDVIQKQPSYIEWCDENVDWLEFSYDILMEAQESLEDIMYSSRDYDSEYDYMPDLGDR